MIPSKKTAVLLVNLGSPDSPKPKDVYRYLTQFLNDPRVIDLPWLGRFLLVNGIIVPFRHRKSAKVYSELWTEHGSPLIHYGRRTQALLQEKFAESSVKVFLGMRYQNPSIVSQLLAIKRWNPDKLIVIPLFPQYASATTGSVIEKIMRIIKDLWVFPEIVFVNQFYDHPLVIEGYVEQGRKYPHADYDHVLFSYHGLPERQLDKIYDDRKCRNHSCEHEINDENKFCYKAACYATTRLIVEKLGIPEDKYTVCFQSRLGGGWVEPFSDKVIEQWAAKGAKKLLVFSPAFVSDCLETIVEIGDEYQELFEEKGGHKVQLVPSLNDNPTWIAALEDMVKARL
jgi:protoporphyrin/coproporphyrin ferrochelatase